MYADGWIKLHRKILANWIVDDPEYFRAWVLLLMSVNYEPSQRMLNGKPVTLQPGEMVTSYAHLATVCRITEKQARRFVDTLKREKMIDYQTTRKGARLSICNFSTYQDRGQPEGSQRAAKGQHSKNISSYEDIRGKDFAPLQTAAKQPKATRKTFVVPERSEVLDYADAIEMRKASAELFYDHFTSNGWKVSGKTPMKDWKAALRKWKATSPPTAKQVHVFFSDVLGVQYRLDAFEVQGIAKAFFDYYEVRGWKLYGNVPVANWKAKATEWFHKNRGTQ